MNTITAAAIGVIIGSISKSLFETIVPNSLKDHLNAKRELKLQFNKLYTEVSKLHSVLSTHRMNISKSRPRDNSDYYLNIIYCFYKFQAIIKLMEETSEEAFIKLPKRYNRLDNSLKFVHQSINSAVFFSRDNDFKYEESNTISKISIDKAICLLLKDDPLLNKKVIINILEFEILLEKDQLVKKEVEHLMTYLKQMTHDHKDFSFIRLHLIIYSLRLLNTNIDSNKHRKKGISNRLKIREKNSYNNLDLKNTLSQHTFERFSKELELMRNKGVKTPEID